MNKIEGFTLIELLIGLFLTGLILVFIGSLITSSAQDTSRISSNADVIKDGQIAQQLITGRLSEAIYVWPVTATSFLLSNGLTTKNTVGTPGQQWTVNTDPFVAMVLPPTGAANYDTTGAITNCTLSATDGCYRFFAYYAMKRSNLSTLLPTEKPKSDPANDNQWVLMEYRAMMYDNTGSGAWTPNYVQDSGVKRLSGPPSAIYYQSSAGQPRSGVLLADYIQPNSVTFTVTRPTGVATGQAVPNGTVNFAFKMQRLVGSSALRATGAAADTMGAIVSPRNWVCPRLLSCP